MRSKAVLFGAVVLSLALASCARTPTASGAAPDAASEARVLALQPGEVSVIVALKPEFAPGGHAANQARAAQVAHGLGLNPTYTYGSAVFGFAASIPEGRLNALSNDPRVQSVSLDRELHALRKPGGGSGSQSLPTGIDRIDGELSTTASGNGSGSVDVDVAVIDTGIDLTHPELNVVGGYNCSRGTSYADGNGHGTHVAGTIGAIDNGSGVVGVAPGARLWAVRVLDNSGSGSWSSVVCGIDWVTQHASTIEAANMSLGGSGSDGACTADALHQAICNSVSAGVTYAVAAGNESDDAKNHVPAAYDQVITVSALADFDGKAGGGAAPTCRTDEDDSFANFSNYGADVDIIAPGVCITSTWKGGGYNTISGTSMATPHVTGAAALYLAAHPGATPSQVRSALLSAGNSNWNNSDDRDNTKEPLLNVGSF